MTSTLTNVVFYANDPEALSHFWSDVFAYQHQRFESELRATLLASRLTDADLAKRGLAKDPASVGPLARASLPNERSRRQ